MNNKARALNIEHLSVTARLNDLAVYMQDGQVSRLQKIHAVLEQIDPGVYLLGTGPYTQGVFSIMCDEVIIGRLATVLEKPLDVPVDILINDGVTLTPREVSRVHCAIYRAEGTFRHDYFLVDRGSTCGTYLNGERLEAPGSKESDEVRRVSRSLNDGDVISLGNSFVNTFLFADLRNQKTT